MRRKIAKRLKHVILRRGATISNAHFVKEPGWKRKDCGYVADIEYNGWKIASIAYDELECYRFALDAMNDPCEKEPYPNGKGNNKE